MLTKAGVGLSADKGGNGGNESECDNAEVHDK